MSSPPVSRSVFRFAVCPSRTRVRCEAEAVPEPLPFRHRRAAGHHPRADRRSCPRRCRCRGVPRRAGLGRPRSAAGNAVPSGELGAWSVRGRSSAGGSPRGAHHNMWSGLCCWLAQESPREVNRLIPPGALQRVVGGVRGSDAVDDFRYGRGSPDGRGAGGWLLCPSRVPAEQREIVLIQADGQDRRPAVRHVRHEHAVAFCVISAVSPWSGKADCTRTSRASSQTSACGTTDELIIP